MPFNTTYRTWLTLILVFGTTIASVFSINIGDFAGYSEYRSEGIRTENIVGAGDQRISASYVLLSRSKSIAKKNAFRPEISEYFSDQTGWWHSVLHSNNQQVASKSHIRMLPKNGGKRPSIKSSVYFIKHRIQTLCDVYSDLLS